MQLQGLVYHYRIRKAVLAMLFVLIWLWWPAMYIGTKHTSLSCFHTIRALTIGQENCQVSYEIHKR